MATGEKITDKEFIYTLLKRLQQQKALLSVSVPLAPGTYNSAILNISQDKTELLLDELHPQEGHLQLLKIGSLQVNSQSSGTGLTFEAELKKVNTDEQISKYHVSFPKFIWYNQQRETFRVQVANDLQFSVELQTEGHGGISGQVIDISQTGIGASFEHYLPFERGDLINHCRLVLPQLGRIGCRLIVKHIKHTEHPAATHIGAMLVDLEGEARKAYLQTIANIQREMIRRHNKVSSH